jgi:SAM-dependent methyltransferase
MQEQLVDWHQVWKDIMENCTIMGRKSGTLKQWSTSEAEKFLQDSDNRYVEYLMKKIELTSKDNVIDIGCGPGRLTIPLAKKVNNVTAVDTSKGMLNVLKRRAKEEGLDNISCVNKFWREVEVGKDIKPEYDVAIASNSINLLGAKEIQKNGRTQLDWNLTETLDKIGSVGKNNYLTMPMLHHKSRSEIFAALGRSYQPFPDYVVVHNVLHQLAIKPEIQYFLTKCKRINTPEKVLKRIEWVCDIKPEQREILKEKIRRSAENTEDGLQVWALIHWHQN